MSAPGTEQGLDALLYEAQAIQQEDNDLIAWLRQRTHALNATVRQKQAEIDDLKHQLADAPNQATGEESPSAGRP